VQHGEGPAGDLVGMEFLYLVRTGLRPADDPRIVDTVRLVDRVLRADTPSGPAYYRYNGDGYGEHADGAPFDGIGVGRPWPLLAGERGHYAALAGEDPTEYLDAMVRMVGSGGLIPEQIWDGEPLPERGLMPGKPSGSAMPLVWAHAEFLKLLATVATRRPVELFHEVEDRYGNRRPSAACWHWRETSPFARLARGKALSIEATAPFVLHLGFNGWMHVSDRTAAPNGFGICAVRLEPSELAEYHSVEFTFYDAGAGRWSGKNFSISLAE
jgi:glucoamylase